MKTSKMLSGLLCAVVLVGVGVALPVTGEPEPEWVVLEDMQNHLHFVNLKQSVPRVHVDDSNITFYYFSRNTQSYELKLKTASRIFNTDFNSQRKTMFIIHGWTGNGQSVMNKRITEALLDADDWNVFNVDWHVQASKNYILAKGSLPSVANIIANFIYYLKDYTGLHLDHVHIAGHSLGGQMSGRVGALLNGEAASIIGLDPALPMFDYKNLEDRLDPSDAQYVHVIHTNGGLLGYDLPLGHSDFYPNGGKKQKGCENDLFGMCSHVRAYLLFVESIKNNNFLAHSCEDYEKFIDGHCYDNHNAYMGGNKLDKSASGSYYLETAACEPFSLS